MEKFIVKTMSLTLAFCISLAAAYAYFTASNEVEEKYSIAVETSGGVTFTETSNNSGKLAPITASGGAFVDQKGNSSTKYYEVSYTVTTEKAKALKLTDIDVDSDLGMAVRVQTSLNGSERTFAPEGRTASNAIGDSVGVVNKTATLTVRIYLEGTDAACIDANITNSLDVGLTFSI